MISRKLLVFTTHISVRSQSFLTHRVNVYLGGMRWLAVLLFVPWIGSAQVIPSSSSYNADIVWEGVYTDGPAGKVLSLIHI